MCAQINKTQKQNPLPTWPSQTGARFDYTPKPSALLAAAVKGWTQAIPGRSGF
jgi:hypothetical protein